MFFNDPIFSAMIFPIIFLTAAALLIEFVRRPLTIFQSEQYDDNDKSKPDFTLRLIIQMAIIIAMVIIFMVISGVTHMMAFSWGGLSTESAKSIQVWSAVLLFGGYGLYLAFTFIRGMRFRITSERQRQRA